MDAEALYLDVVEKTSAHLNPYLSRLMAFAGFGVEMRAEGCYVYDQDGKAYLDCLGGYGTFSLGHRHPRIVAAVKDQLDRIALSGKAFFSKPAADLADALAEITPDGIDYCFFNNSGTEAVEGALKFARAATGRAKIVSTFNSFHGKTLGALSVMGREKYRKPFEPLIPGVSFVPYGDAEAAARAIDAETAAMIIEPIQGEGGIIVPPDGYLHRLREACDRAGALLIVDEVQTLFGRTGYWFGCNHDDARPDLITMAKSLGGGVMPIGALAGTKAIWHAIYEPNPLAHTSTFGGNNLACAAGLAAIEVVREEDLLERSKAMGAKLQTGLREVAARFPELILEVRGRALMIGLEFRMDEVGELAVAQMLKRGMCVAYTLNNPRVLRFEPPLIIDDAQVQFAVETFADAVGETAELLAELV